MKAHKQILNRDQFSQLCRGKVVRFTTNIKGTQVQIVDLCLADISFATMADVVANAREEKKEDAAYKSKSELSSNRSTKPASTDSNSGSLEPRGGD